MVLIPDGIIDAVVKILLSNDLEIVAIGFEAVPLVSVKENSENERDDSCELIIEGIDVETETKLDLVEILPRSE